MEEPKNSRLTHGHELRWGNAGGRWCAGQRGIKWREKNGTTVIAKSTKHILKKENIF